VTQPVSAGGVGVLSIGGELVAARDGAAGETAGLAGGIVARDATLWGPQAADEAARRLGWLDCTHVSRALVPRIEALRDELRAEGIDRVVLAGMGGSSLAPEVISKTYGVALTVLDTTDPAQVESALREGLERTVLVVSSKSGGTVETDSHRRVFLKAFRDMGLSEAEANRRLVVVTDPGSPLAEIAASDGVREVFLADPNIGGRYSALSAFGLVPTGLAGAPIGDLLDQAAEVEPSLALDTGNPALALGLALGGYGRVGHDKVVISDAGSGITGFGDWAEQLIAESTGKSGRGLLPVVVEAPDSPGFAVTHDSHPVLLGGVPEGIGTAVSGPLGAQFLVWEFATAVAGRVLEIDPFNQPNVAESKDNTSKVLDAAGEGPLPDGEPVLVDGAVEVYAEPALASEAHTLGAVIARLLDEVPGNGYLAVMAYLDRLGDRDAAALRPLLAARTGQPVTFGWGPRFLHSTGQFHKGGPPVGAFLQVTGAHEVDLDVPGRAFTLGRLQHAQALGDSQAIRSRQRPFVRLHLTDRTAGLRQLIAAATGDDT
jgi:glucose-6-phosphate isomerase